MGRDTRATWAKRVERWVASGLSAAEFATETGVNARTLTYWKWKLGRTKRAPTRKLEFVEVTPSEITVASTARAPEQLEVVLGGGIVVRVPARFDTEVLRRVVAALGGA